MALEKCADPHDETLRITLSGELTRPECAAFKTWVLQQMDDHRPVRVEVDCQHLQYIDSAGLGSLIFFQKVATERQSALRLVQISGWLQKFLNVTGLEQTFTAGGAPRGVKGGPA